MPPRSATFRVLIGLAKEEEAGLPRLSIGRSMTHSLANGSTVTPLLIAMLAVIAQAPVPAAELVIEHVAVVDVVASQVR